MSRRSRTARRKPGPSPEESPPDDNLFRRSSIANGMLESSKRLRRYTLGIVLPIEVIFLTCSLLRIMNWAPAIPLNPFLDAAGTSGVWVIGTLLLTRIQFVVGNGLCKQMIELEGKQPPRLEGPNLDAYDKMWDMFSRHFSLLRSAGRLLGLGG